MATSQNDKKTSLVLPSYMMQTNGGGSIERVPGFDQFLALTAGFETRRIVGPTVLASRPDGGFFSQSAAQVAVSSGAPAGKPENVIGVDNRVQVTDASTIPWRCICHLEIEYERGPVGFGTGFLLGPALVVTAAHVLVDRKTRGWGDPRLAKRVRVVPGRNGTLAPYGYFVADTFKRPTVWEDKESDAIVAMKQDYAAIVIPNEHTVGGEYFGDRLGYFGLKVFQGDEEEQQAKLLLVNNAGYPYEADKPYGTLWYNAGRISGVDEVYFEYMVDTEGGQSGSPIYVYDEATNERYVVAIHTTGDFMNRGLRITPEIFDVLKSWAGKRKV